MALIYITERERKATAACSLYICARQRPRESWRKNSKMNSPVIRQAVLQDAQQMAELDRICFSVPWEP